MARPFEGKYFKCLHCTKEFRRSQCEIARGRTKYCGHKCSGAAKSGENNPSWSGGKHITSYGYIKVRHEGKYVFLHRKIVEEFLGRKLGEMEDVHHRDEDKTNNDISNLIVLTKAEHSRLHHSLKPQRYCWCGNKHYCKELCKLHYERMRRSLLKI